MNRNDFYRLLVKNEILTVEEAHELSASYKSAFDVVPKLLELEKTSRQELGWFIGNNLNIAYVNLQQTLFQESALRLLPQEAAKRLKAIPLYTADNGLALAIASPDDQKAILQVEKITGYKVEPVFSFPDEIEDYIEIEYSKNKPIENIVDDVAVLLKSKSDYSLIAGSTEATVNLDELKKISGSDAVIELTQSILLIAAKEKASDIHIEPTSTNVKIRFRIDGILEEKYVLAKNILPLLVSRLKILAKLDITEKRKPQDGRISLVLSSQSIDYRFASAPSIYGETIVLRVLGQLKNKSVPDLKDLHLLKIEYAKLKKCISVPNGIFLVSGPTGSGKSTTLYSALKHLNSPHINIVTIEDPVEFRLEGINQYQVNPAVGFDFATALRSFLRHDPDIMLVGEIRDRETAQIAIEAALTGHLVLSTIHTNSSLESFVRLSEMGVEPYLVSSALAGVLSQRLVRRLCDVCKEEYAISQEQKEKLFFYDNDQIVYFYRAKGCSHCRGAGYSGRLAISELVLSNKEMRHLITSQASILELEVCARDNGFRTLRYDGVMKVLKGLTTIEEIDRVCFTL